ncbi:hypothetical protein J1614_007580 [Plenodomus biglobosus]|nr:hypothetical protein J1614_007580 [Plenodomus biglobosus]
MTSTILITGASSGLGLSFTKHYASLASPPSILALDISPFPTSSLPASSLNHISFHKLDISCASALSAFASQHTRTCISLILHCAGVRGLVTHMTQTQPGDVAGAETLAVMDTATLLRAFKVNTVGTFNVVRTFLPNLLLHASADSMASPELSASLPSPPSTSSPLSRGQTQSATATVTGYPRVVVLSSRMSSVAANTTGGAYAYRASKAALNAVVKSFSVDVPEVRFLLLHPGRVETGLVEWKEEGAIGVEESVEDCLRAIEGEGWESGSLVDRFGVEIPW